MSLQWMPRKVSKNIVSRPDPEGKPTQVEVGIWIIDIDSIDSVSQSFDANIYIILRWKDSSLIDKDKADRKYPLDEIWSPEILIANESGIVRRSFPETVQVDAKGSVTYRQRYVGSFSQPLKLKDFPFDRHSLRYSNWSLPTLRKSRILNSYPIRDSRMQE